MAHVISNAVKNIGTVVLIYRFVCYKLPYNHSMPIDVQIEDRVQMRKQHPCGSFEWKVTRIGADIGLECVGCTRRVLLPRSKFEKRLKKILNRDVDLGR